MNQQSQKQPNYLANLQAYEKRLLDYEKRLKELDHHITIAESTLAARRVQQDSELKEHQRSVDQLAQQAEALQENIVLLAKRAGGKQTSLDAVTQKEKFVRQKIADAKQELAQIEQEVDTRKIWLKQQEALIAKTVEDGNLEIKSLHYEIQDIVEHRNEVNAELAEANNNKSLVIDDLATLERERDQLEQENNSVIARLQKKLTEVRTELAAAQEKLVTVTAETTAKLTVLQAKEDSLLAKQAALKKESAEVNTRWRRLNGQESLYNT